MPTTYAHDLFGKKVYRKLPDEVKEIIRENGELYRIGLHGPDILFYFMVSKNPVSTFGVRMHSEKARAFFEEGMAQVRKTGSRPLLAYMLGFGCHYLLDSVCHPYVDEVADKGELSHTLLEKEFDRCLMLETGKNPLHFYPSDCIVPEREYAEVIHQVLPLIPSVCIHISLKMMKFLTNLMVCDDNGRRRGAISRILGLGGKKNQNALIEHFMLREPVAGSAHLVAELEKLYDQAALAAPSELMELYGLAEEEKPLSERWNRTYNG